MKVSTPILRTVLVVLLMSVFSHTWADNVKNDTGISEDDRRSLLASISKKAILPIFTELDVASSKLVKQAELFCESKNESTLLELRASWLNTANAWQQTDSLLFGPTVDDNIDFAVYFLPIKKGIIKGLLKQDELSVKDVEAAGVGAQGLGALEYLLFSREQSLTVINQRFIDDPRRCKYLLQATDLMHQNIHTISQQWQHYGEQFALAGNNSLFFFESQEAMILWVNKLYQSAQKVSNKKLGLLSNKQKVKKSTSYKLQAWRSGSSLAQAKANIKGIQRILNDGKVLQWMKAHNKTQAAEEIGQVIEQILSQNVKQNDLFTELQSAPENLQVLVKNTQKLTELIQTQLAPSLGVELGFNDNDGD